MPRLVDGIDVIARVRACALLDEQDDEGDTFFEVVHYDDTEGAMAEFEDDIDFLTTTPEELTDLAQDLANQLAQQILTSLLLIRDELRIASETADLIDRAEQGDQDWEV